MSVAAKRYATALMDVLYPEAEAGLHQLQNFASLFADQPDARGFLENPAMAGDRRNRLLKEISDALGFDRPVANFVNILSDRGRLPLLEEIIDEYQTLLDQRMGIARARVTAAHPLDAVQQRELIDRLEQITGKQVRMEVAIDPSLIGGLIIRVGDQVLDNSLRARLSAIQRSMLAS